MRAFTLESFDAPPGPREDLPAPEAGPDQVLVRVQASSVNPIDTFIAAGYLKDVAPHAVPVGWVAHLPGEVDLAQAGAAPLAALTALAASDALDLGPGSTVLVVGASGGVGTVAVQLATAAGATVLAPGLPEDADYLRGLGVAEVLGRDGDVPAQVRERHPDGVDALVDLVSRSPDQLDVYGAAVRDGGRVASSVGAAGDGPGRTNARAVPSAETLDRLAELLADGTLRVPIQASYPLAQADQALKTLTGQHTQGKLAIALA